MKGDVQYVHSCHRVDIWMRLLQYNPNKCPKPQVKLCFGIKSKNLWNQLSETL